MHCACLPAELLPPASACQCRGKVEALAATIAGMTVLVLLSTLFRKVDYSSESVLEGNDHRQKGELAIAMVEVIAPLWSQEV